MGDSPENPLSSILASTAELKASLERSRKALLALDLAGIELGAEEQIRLAARITASIERVKGLPLCRIWQDGKNIQELQSTVGRVLYAARVQAALLGRLQSKQIAMARMLVGTSMTYAPVDRTSLLKFEAL